MSTRQSKEKVKRVRIIIMLMILGLFSTFLSFDICMGMEVAKRMMSGKAREVGDNWCEYPPEPLGEEFYSVWKKGDLPWPLNITMEEREKMAKENIKDLALRYYYGTLGGAVWGGTAHLSSINVVEDAKGNARRRWWEEYYAFVGEYNKAPYRYRKYYMNYKWPEEFQDLAYLSLQYYPGSGKSDEWWVYYPTMRKVRRYSDASKQDCLSGALFRVDDFSPRFEDYEYKLVKDSQILTKEYEKDVFGVSDDVYRDVNFLGTDHWVIETIPKNPWYYAKKVSLLNKDTLCVPTEWKYDRNGKLILTTKWTYIAFHGPTARTKEQWALIKNGKEKEQPNWKDWYIFYKGVFTKDYRSNQVGYAASLNTYFWPPNLGWDTLTTRELLNPPIAPFGHPGFISER